MWYNILDFVEVIVIFFLIGAHMFNVNKIQNIVTVTFIF